MSTTGAFRERLHEAWTELRGNPGRSFLQALGVMLGVASVLGGFSISDSQRQQTEQHLRPHRRHRQAERPAHRHRLPGDAERPAQRQPRPAAGGRDRRARRSPRAKAVNATSVLKNARARVRSEFADQERDVNGIGADYVPLNGYEIEQGRDFSAHDFATGAPVAMLGAEAASVFFPTGEIVGKPLRIGDVPVTVIGVFHEKSFRFREGQQNIFAWRNQIVAVPSGLVAARMDGDAYHRVDRVTFRIPDLEAMADFSRELTSLVGANHRLQDDFRLDDVDKRMERQRSQGDVYNIIFMLSGVLALIGGGMVNVNIQLASLKERVREVGVKMAIGAPGARSSRPS